MRPDQHKRKKNSDYKKKHGIPPGRGVNHDKKGSTSKDRSGEAPASTQSKAEYQTDNNWDRYKDDEFEDDASRTSSYGPVGEEFQSLLDKTICSSSHFKFKSEKEWESLDTDLENKSGSSLLSINCSALAESLKTISTEQRLEIDKKYTTQMEYRASTNQAKANMMDHHAIEQKIASVETTEKLKQNMSPSLAETNKLTTQKDTDKCSEIHKLKSPEEKVEHCSTVFQNKTEKMHNLSRKKYVGEDNVDISLRTDNKEVNQANIDNGMKVIKAANTTTVLEAQSSSDTKENLEVWLDSVLD